MHDSPPRGRDGAAERPPTSVLLVLTWDVVLAIGVLFVALAAFGGGVEVRGHTSTTPIAVEVLQALGYASFGAVLILLSIVLVRRAAWVRRAQVATLSLAAGLGLVSFAVDQVVAGHGLDVAALLGTLLVVLVDALAVLAMTGDRVVAWYREPGAVPLYLGVLIVFWATSSAAFFTLRVLS